MSDARSAVLLRPYRTSDEGFVASSLLRSMRETELCRRVPETLYRSQMSELLVQHVLSAPVVAVCHALTSDDDLIGWVSGETGNELRFVYVKQDFRSQGVGAVLLEDALGLSNDDAFSFTLTTLTSHKFLKRYPAASMRRGNGVAAR